MSEGFLMNTWQAMVFYRYCRIYHLDDNVDKRTAIMRRLVAKKKVTYIRNSEEFCKGKRVLKITAKPRGPECSSN